MNKSYKQGRYVLLAVLALLAQVAWAVTSGFTELPIAATDGKRTSIASKTACS
jgi:hypothetical protein